MKARLTFVLVFLILLFWVEHNINARSVTPQYYDGQLYIQEPMTKEWKLLDVNSRITLTQEAQLYFRYIIRRAKHHKSRAGAVAVKVIRIYNKNWKIGEHCLRYTYLFRNKFPNKNKLERNQRVRREIYEMYHQDDIGNIFLRQTFHTFFSRHERTDEPASRRENFLYYDDSNEKTRQRSYLLYYSGIREEGSKIPFEVGVTRGAYSKILISISDLCPPSEIGYQTRNWEISMSGN